jgi:hypothetical protein
MSIAGAFLSAGDITQPMRKSTAALFAVLALLALSTSACTAFEEGPSLRNVTVQDGLSPTLGDVNACCCRVTGTVRNDNDVTVHVTITWAAFESETATEPFGRILHFVNDLEPGGVRAFETPANGDGASGFLFPCASIGTLRREVAVRGLYFP